MTTDREALDELLTAIDDHYGPNPVPVPIATACARAVRHLRTPPPDCSAEVERASRAAYAAGQAAGAGARADLLDGP